MKQVRKPVTVSREELYREVWQTPMQHLAVRYGISVSSLAEICLRLRVPRPYLGYWAKRAVGKPTRQLELPPANIDTPRQVVITPTPPLPLSRPQATQSPKMRERYERTLHEASTIRVPTTLTDPHPIIAKWIAEDARLVRDFKRGRNPLRPSALSELDGRRHRILDTLFKELEKRGSKVISGHYHSLCVQIGSERVDFTLREHIRHIRRPVTEKEKKDRFYSGQKWRQEMIPTGNLAFKITSYLDRGVTGHWTDEPNSLLEQKIGEIIAVFVLAGVLLSEKRRVEEGRERRRLEAERRRSEATDRRRREQNRWRRFLDLAGQWRKAEAAREFLAALEAQRSPRERPIGGRRSDTWLKWAHERLKVYDPLEDGIEAVWKNLARVTARDY